MASERNHHISKENSFEVVVVPSGDASKTRSIKLSRRGIIAGIVGIVLCISGITIALILYTPLSLLFPVSDIQISQRYGSQLFDVQKRLGKLSQEVLILREYNRKLRFALGQQAPNDTIDLALMTPAAVDTTEYAAGQTEPGLGERTASLTSSNVRTIMPSSASAKEISFQPRFPMTAPVSGYISRTMQPEQGHYGIDYAGKIGALIVAPADGYIVYTGWTIDDGNIVVVAHGDGYATIYKHNQSVLKSVGEFIKRGETIALLGNTGRTSHGPHLHFELWKDGRPRNPNEYFIVSTL